MGKGIAKIVKWDIDKDDEFGGKGFTSLSNRVIYYILNELGQEKNDKAELHTILFLITVAYGGYKIHKSQISQKTGLSESAYYEGLKRLEARGWVEKNNEAIILKWSVLVKEIEKIDSQPKEVEVKSDLEIQDGDFVW